MTPLVAGTTVLLADERGDAPAGSPSAVGLFVDDTRHLSRWELLVDGARPRVLSTRRDAVAAEVVLAPEAVRGADPPHVLFRTQVLADNGLVERLRVRDLTGAPGAVSLSYLAAADFIDQFQLRGDHDRPGGELAVCPEPDRLVLRYWRADYVKWTVITADAPMRVDEEGIHCEVPVPAGGEVEITVRVSTMEGEPRPVEELLAERRADAERFRAAFALPGITDPRLAGCVAKGIDDLATLRLPGPDLVVAAGVPWYLTLFGRDSLITAMAALPHRPDLAEGTLRALAAHQGERVRPERCEEPGKIPHEIRRGELSRFGQVPYGRYYGTVDATPLFLVLLGAHHEQTGDDALAEELAGAAHAAVRWMRRRGGLDERGYLVYPTDAPGLVHQCWKDSPRSIAFSDGRPATGPIAVVEAQGYAYAALRHAARLARRVWDAPEHAVEWDALADSLRERFTRDFWMPEHDYPALALDGRGEQVDLLASNAGHLLLTGILDQPRAEAVARLLTSPGFRSGWGLRTVAAGQVPYHPASYHNGAVWPHDTAIAVAGLARHGLTDHARLLADDLLDAAVAFDHRLPEVLTGFGRDEVPDPVPYPHSCSPQAWAAAAPLFLLAAGMR